MAVIEQISDHQLVVRNSALKWTIAWAVFVGILIIPAIYLLAASAGSAPSGDADIPSWVGAVLLVLGLLSFCMLLPFTVVTTTRMDKQTDTFMQVIERVDVEGYDGLDQDFQQIVAFDRNEENDSSSDEDAELKEFYARHGGRRAQVLVHTKAESFPITALTSSGAQCLPCRPDRLSPRQVKKVVDRFLGLDAPASEESQPHSPEPAGASPPRSQASPVPGHRASTDSAVEEAAGAGVGAGVGAGALGTTKDALEFMNLPPALRPTTRAAPALVTNPAGRPILPHVMERAEPAPPDTTSNNNNNNSSIDSAGGEGLAKMEVESALASRDAWPEAGAGAGGAEGGGEGSPVSAMRQSSWQRIPGLDGSGVVPKKKKNESEAERRERRAAKKEARKGETPEEREARKAMKKAKKLRKQLKKAGAPAPNQASESMGDTDGGGDGSEGESEGEDTDADPTGTARTMS